MQPVSIGVTWVKFGVWTENPEQAKGPEKRLRRAAKRNGMNMVYSSIIQGQEEGGKGGRAQRNPGKPKINECKREVCYPLPSPSAVIVSNASEVASIKTPSIAIIILQLTLPGEFCKFGSFAYPTSRQSSEQSEWNQRQSAHPEWGTGKGSTFNPRTTGRFSIGT